MAVPRMMARAGSFAFITVPERIDSMLSFRNGGSMIAEATGNGTWNMISAALSAGTPADTAIPGTVPRTAAAMEGTRTMSPLSFMQVRNFGGIFTYMTSKWAMACFTLVSQHHFSLIPGLFATLSHQLAGIIVEEVFIDRL